jgi:hypothetical protein
MRAAYRAVEVVNQVNQHVEGVSKVNFHLNRAGLAPGPPRHHHQIEFGLPALGRMDFGAARWAVN